MLKGRLLHPDLLRALAASGHGSKVLIADSNYPFETHRGPNTEVVYLNLEPGKLLVTEVLDVLAATVPIESASVMLPGDGRKPPIFGEFKAILGDGPPIEELDRSGFYEAVRSEDTCLVIATGEQRVFACILLTIGVILPAH